MHALEERRVGLSISKRQLFWRLSLFVLAGRSKCSRQIYTQKGPAALYGRYLTTLYAAPPASAARARRGGQVHTPSWAGIDGIKFDGRDARRRIGIVRNIISKPTLEICVVSTRSREEEIGEGRWGHFLPLFVSETRSSCLKCRRGGLRYKHAFGLF
jgi:hypothetical protein